MATLLRLLLPQPKDISYLLFPLLQQELQECLLLLYFALHHRCCVFYKLKVKAFVSRKIRACFITRHTLLQCSEKEPTISSRYACIWIESWQGMFYILIAVGLLEKGRLISGAPLLVFLRYASITTKSTIRQ